MANSDSNTQIVLPDVQRVDVIRSGRPFTRDTLLWEVIKDRSAAMSFARYSAFIDNVFSGNPQRPEKVIQPAQSSPRLDAIREAQENLENPDPEERAEAQRFLEQAALDDAKFPSTRKNAAGEDARVDIFKPLGNREGIQHTLNPEIAQHPYFFNGDAYSLLKAATEAFVFHEAGRLEDLGSDNGLMEPPTSYVSDDTIARFRNEYLSALRVEGSTVPVLPYLDIIRGNLAELPVKAGLALGVAPQMYGILRSRITSPVLIELLWNYWQEQGLLVQTMGLISLRFQNIRRGRGLDPLASLELDPLRPLSNVLWGFIQDEINRLTVARRAYEYAHGLGLQLVGRAVPEMHPADVRTQFLPAFHDLLRLAWIFFREDDDKMVVADAFPLLNALREMHFVVSEGAHNQFGDLPLRARIEMLMQQWILARPEMREFLRGRTMVPYPERWMDRVDAMKALQGWNDASVINYNDLAVFGEQIILGVRYGSWSTTTDHNQAANWARAWRPAIQRYTHALKIVSGIDLSIADAMEVRSGAERLAQGTPSARAPYPGGSLSRVAPPPEAQQPLGPRPGADKILRPVPVSAPAQTRGASAPAAIPPRTR